MDPVATLQNIIDEISEYHMVDARDHLEDLIEWRQKGGFLNMRVVNGEED